MLVGFVDNTGEATANLALSKRRADAVAEQMKQRDIQPILVTGFGAELPLAETVLPKDGKKIGALKYGCASSQPGHRVSG